MKYPKVSILILNFNGLPDTIECINSLKKISYTNYEVLVLDNGSSNNEYLKLKNNVKWNNKIIKFYRSPINLGFSGGMNFLLDIVSSNSYSKYVLLLNNDITVEKDFLKYLVNKFVNNPDIAIVSSQIVKYDDNKIIDGLGLSYYKCGLSFAINRGQKINSKIEDKIFTVGAGCALYRMDILNNVKSVNNEYFDEEFFMYAEDLDLGFRLLHLGLSSIYEERSLVYHKGGASSSKNKDFANYCSLRNALFVIFKNYPTKVLMKYLIYILMAQFMMMVLYIKRKKFFIFVKAYVSFIKDFNKMYSKRKNILKNSKVNDMYIVKHFEKNIFPLKYLYYFNTKQNNE